jgi:hypothetical protein
VTTPRQQPTEAEATAIANIALLGQQLAAGDHTMDICTVKPWFEILVAVFALISAGFWFAAPRYNAIAASCAGLAALLQIAVLFMPVCRAFA